MSAFRPNRPLSSARLFRAGAAVLALLASAAAPARAERLLNPAGIVLGGTATFRVDIAPAAFPDAAIRWTAEPASRVSFPAGSSGRTVAVRGEAPGDVALRVAIDGYAGEHPVANARVVPLSTVKADAWIIRDGDNWARTEQEVRLWYHWTNAPAGGRMKSWHETNAPVGFFEHATPTLFLK